jgi:hypothetical protein
MTRARWTPAFPPIRIADTLDRLKKPRRKAVNTETENARLSCGFNVLTDTTRNVGQQKQ